MFSSLLIKFLYLIVFPIASYYLAGTPPPVTQYTMLINVDHTSPGRDTIKVTKYVTSDCTNVLKEEPIIVSPENSGK
jgi:hypothetical protein